MFLFTLIENVHPVFADNDLLPIIILEMRSFPLIQARLDEMLNISEAELRKVVQSELMREQESKQRMAAQNRKLEKGLQNKTSDRFNADWWRALILDAPWYMFMASPTEDVYDHRRICDLNVYWDPSDEQSIEPCPVCSSSASGAMSKQKRMRSTVTSRPSVQLSREGM